MKSYQSGMAEIAAGVIHNVRNALSPVVVTVSHLCEVAVMPPATHLDAAFRDLKSKATKPERRAMLAEYVEAAMKAMLERGQRFAEDLRIVVEQNRHIEQILQDHSALSMDKRRFEPVRLGGVIMEAARLLPANGSAIVEVRVTPNVESMPAVNGHPIVIAQILGNLMVNAAEAIRETGRVSGRIDIDAEAIDGERPRMRASLRQGQRQRHRSRGAEEPVRARLLDQEGEDWWHRPALVGEQHSHHGRPDVRGKQGRRTRSNVPHPPAGIGDPGGREPDQARGKRGRMTNMPSIGGAAGFRVLVADDEQAVLDAYRTVIEDINPPFARRSTIEDLESKLFGETRSAMPAPTFTPVLCRQGEDVVQTLKAAREAGEEFPVAFLDVRMPPGIDGIEAAARIRAIDPEINIVIVTGYTDAPLKEIAARVPPLDKLFYVSKPFQKMELQQFVFALTAKWRADRTAKLAMEQLNQHCKMLETANAAIQKERERADAANLAKSEFLAKMSHELRTPLNAVIGFAEVMRAGAYGPVGNERYQRYLDDIAFSGNHLLSMINDLLDISTIDIGMLKVDTENVDLDEVVQGVASLMRIHAENARVELRLDHQANCTLLQADERRLRQILVNLIGNAIKFTEVAGIVAMTTRMDREQGLHDFSERYRNRNFAGGSWWHLRSLPSGRSRSFAAF